MKTMKIEKHLLYPDDIKKLVKLSVQEQLTYAKEEDGIRANGPLDMKGSYETADGRVVEFQEILQMDVLAPKEKLSDLPFSLHIESYEGTIDSDGILVCVMMSIHGLKEETQGQEEAIPSATPKPIQSEPSSPSVEVIEENANEAEDMEHTEDSDEVEDLFEDAETTYVSYRMVVAKPQDTYASIAGRYEVKEADLREYNHNKAIEPKSLVILP